MRNKILHACLLLCGIFILNVGIHAQGGSLPINSTINGVMTSSTPQVWNVTTGADGLLRVKLTATNPADLFVSLYDNDGVTLLAGPVESWINNPVAIINGDGLAAGTYHLKISVFGLTAFGSYTLTDSLYTGLVNDIEPNASSAAAIALPVNDKKTGHVGYYYNLKKDTADWYKITTTNDGLLRVYLATERGSVFSSNGLDVNVNLYDNNGSTLLGNVEVFNTGNPASNMISVDGLAPGTYYVRVQCFSTGGFANYTIKDSLFTSSLANDAEPNANKAAAIDLPVNDKKTGHVGYYYNLKKDTADWYKITTTNDGLLRVYLATERGSVFSNNALDVNVNLYDNDGTTPLGNVEVFNVGNPASNMISVDGLAPGTYYVRVQCFSTNQFANYTIKDSLFTSSLANDAEPNANKAAAIDLPVNDKKTGHVGYYYNLKKDTADWYKITTTNDGLLRVYLTTARGSVFSNNTLDVNVNLYDNDGTTPLGNVEVFNVGNPASNMISADGLAPGTYYVRVQCFSTGQFANYTISDSLFTSSLANDAEPNANKTAAIDLPVNDKKTGHVGYYYNLKKDTADWYKITTTADGLLRVYLTTARGSVYSNNALDVNVNLYDNNGTTPLGNVEVFNVNNPASNMITADGLAPGTYYIRVQCFSTNQFANYTISDSLFVPASVADNEPNATAATALPLSLNRTVKGHNGFYFNNTRDTADWYQLIIPGAVPMHIYLSTNRATSYSTNTLDMNLFLYGADAKTQVAFKEVFNAGKPAIDSLVFTNLAAGTYYIKIASFSANGFGIYSLTNSILSAAGSLPVTLINFMANVRDNQVLLNWKTASESNNKGFSVERSSDGLSFSAIGFVDGHGNSSDIINYSFADNKPISGKSYYRLKQVDMDGNFVYSDIVQATWIMQAGWSISGNPVTATTAVHLQLLSQSHISIMVTNNDGKIVRMQDKGTITAGNYYIPLNLGELPRGTYFVSLIQENNISTKIILK